MTMMTQRPRSQEAPRWLIRDRIRATRLDWILIAAALALSALSCVLVSSAGAAVGAVGLGRKQFLGLLLALVLAALVTRVEPRSLRA